MRTSAWGAHRKNADTRTNEDTIILCSFKKNLRSSSNTQTQINLLSESS